MKLESMVLGGCCNAIIVGTCKQTIPRLEDSGAPYSVIGTVMIGLYLPRTPSKRLNELGPVSSLCARTASSRPE